MSDFTLRLCSISVLLTVGMTFFQTTAKAQLTSSSVVEMSCPEPKDMPVANPKEVDMAVFNNPDNYMYMPMGSKFFVRHNAEAFLGRPAKDQAELDKMDYYTSYTGVKGAANYSGYGKSMQHTCYPFTRDPNKMARSLFQYNCFGINASEGTDPAKLSSFMANLWWTDNKTALLWNRCMDGRYLEWGVWNKEPTLPQIVKDTVLTIIKNFGFNDTLVEYVNYPSP